MKHPWTLLSESYKLADEYDLFPVAVPARTTRHRFGHVRQYSCQRCYAGGVTPTLLANTIVTIPRRNDHDND